MTEFAERIKQIVGTEYWDEFLKEMENYTFGEPEEWEYDEDLLEYARLCDTWHTDDEVKFALKIQNAIRVEFKYHGKTHHELPFWTEYYCVSDLLDAAKALENTHTADVMYLPEFKDDFDIEDEDEDELDTTIENIFGEDYNDFSKVMQSDKLKRGLVECYHIAIELSKEYSLDELTLTNIRKDHPELNFMDDEEINDLIQMAIKNTKNIIKQQ